MCLRLDLGQHVAELGEFGLDCPQHLPDFAGAFFQRQRAKAHLQRTQHGQQRGRARQGYAMLTLQGLHQARATKHLGVQPFGGQEQDGEIGGVWRLQVLVGNGAGLQADTGFKRLARRIGAGHIGIALGVEQALVVLVGELGVDGQPQRCAMVQLARQFDGKVHHVLAARARGNLRGKLVGREDLFEQAGQLRLAKDAAGLHVGQQMLEVPHALRQRLHLAQALVHLLQPVGHLLEALAQACLQRGLELLVHRGAHFVELGGVGRLQLGQLLVQRVAHGRQAARVGIVQLGQSSGGGLAHAGQLGVQGVGYRLLKQRELLAKGVDLGVLRARGFGTLLRQRLLEGGQGLAQLLARTLAGLLHFVAQFALQPLAALLDQGAQVLQLLALQLGLQFIALCAAHAHQNPGQQCQIHQRQCQQHPYHHVIHRVVSLQLAYLHSTVSPPSHAPGNRSGCPPPAWPWHGGWRWWHWRCGG